jgi:hypothetical protein
MFSSAALGRKLGFHTSSAFTRVLVLNASDTCDAISARRPGWAWPKPSARASGLLMTVSMASLQAAGFERHVHDAIARLDVFDGGSRVGNHFLGALGEGREEGLDGAGFSLMSLGDAMITLPYSFTPKSA